MEGGAGGDQEWDLWSILYEFLTGIGWPQHSYPRDCGAYWCGSSHAPGFLLPPGPQDPEGIKIRAATGLEAIDYFIQGYWWVAMRLR